MEYHGSETTQPRNIKQWKSKHILPAENTCNKSEEVTVTLHAGSGITCTHTWPQLNITPKKGWYTQIWHQQTEETEVQVEREQCRQSLQFINNLKFVTF